MLLRRHPLPSASSSIPWAFMHEWKTPTETPCSSFWLRLRRSRYEPHSVHGRAFWTCLTGRSSSQHDQHPVRHISRRSLAATNAARELGSAPRDLPLAASSWPRVQRPRHTGLADDPYQRMSDRGSMRVASDSPLSSRWQKVPRTTGLSGLAWRAGAPGTLSNSGPRADRWYARYEMETRPGRR